MMTFGDTMPDWMKEEPLHVDLAQYIRAGGMLGEMVHSPLVISPLTTGRTRCSMINGLYAQKVAQLREAMEAKQWSRAIMLHERPYRFEALTTMLDKGLVAGSPTFWKAVGQVWIDSENIYENFSAWREMWRHDPQHRHCAMTEDDRATFSELRNRFRVYRGYDYRGTRKGMSWTLSRKRAIWFAHRFDEQGGGHVVTGEVAKENVLAFFSNRSEQEIVIDPGHVDNIEAVEI